MQLNKKHKRILYPSPLRYPGGKAALSTFISKIIDSKNNANEITFVEPFAGGAGAALSLLFEGKASKIIINDLDPAIYAFWKIAIFDTNHFIQKIEKTKISIYEWMRQRKIYKNKKSSKFELAFATFFLNRTNRSGIIEGGPIGGKKQIGKWKLNSRFNKKGLIARLRRISEFRNQIKVTNRDGIELLSLLVKSPSKNQYLIFLDPPYIQKGQSLYLNHYEEEDHESLADFLKTSKLDWIMTYDDTRYIRNLYSDKHIKEFKISHAAYRRKIGKEVFISPRIIRERIAV